MDVADFSTFLRDYLNEFTRQIQLGLICKIEKFDKEKMRADVQPFMKIKNKLDEETTYPILSDLPVQFIYAGGFYIRPMYERGDIVWVSFSTYDISEGLNETSRTESERTFSMENACVSHAIASSKFKTPAEFSSEDGLIIGEGGGNSYMVYSKDDIKMKFNSGATEVIFSSDEIKMKFNSGATEIKFSSTGIDCDSEVTANKKILPIALSTHKQVFTGMGSVGTPLP